MESSPREQTRFIEDLRGKHQGEEIWILGTSPALDAFPDDFFDDKITITLNWAIVAFPECTYWHGHHEEYREYLRDERPDLLPKSIISFPFPGHFKHGRITDPAEFFGDLTHVPIWMRFGDCRPIPKRLFVTVVEQIMAGEDNCRYRASATVAHTAIEAAAVMGAKRITLIGCEHFAWGHAQKRGMGKRYGRRVPLAYTRDRRYHDGTRWLAELLGEHGVEVVRYFYEDVKHPGLEHYTQGYHKIKRAEED